MRRLQDFRLISNNQHVGTAGERGLWSGTDATRRDELSQLRELLEARITPSYSEPQRVFAIVHVVAPISIRIACDLSPIAITLAAATRIWADYLHSLSQVSNALNVTFGRSTALKVFKVMRA